MAHTEKNLINAVKTAAVPVLLIWVIHIIKVAGNFHWGRFGVFPRELDGIAGIFFAPLIHGDFQHLLSNSVPLFFLTSMILFFYKRVAVISLLLLYFITGLLVWLFARQVYHIGASGVVYAMVSFVFWNGVFRKNLKSVVLALVIVVMYGSYFVGIVPNQPGISWESHLLGGLTGIVVSFIFRNQFEEDEIEHDPWENEDYTPTDYFLDRDAFKRNKNDHFSDPFA
jgi:membrane associated rhomboid family serine protease